jgi:gliding motility-associated-like protein
MVTVRHIFRFIFLLLGSMPTFAQAPCPPLDAGNDTIVCSASSVQLSASAGFDTYEWFPAVGLNNQNIRNPMAAVTGDMTYVVRATSTTSNLVANGDFSTGNVGFTNDYTFLNVEDPCNYTVSTNIFNWWVQIQDHSPSADNMFMSLQTCDIIPSVLWQQTINPIMHQSNYHFSFWTTHNCYCPSVFAVYFIGNVTGEELLDTIYINPQFLNSVPDMVWEEYTVPVWNSGNNTSVTIRIECLTDNAPGILFLMDDIHLSTTACISTDSVHISYIDVPPPVVPADTTVCQYAVLPPLQAVGQNIQWYTSPASGMGSNVAPVPDTDGNLPITYYATQTLSGCESKMASITIDMVKAPYFDLGPDATYCIGEEIKIGPDIDPLNQYTWMDSLHVTPRVISDEDTNSFVLHAQNFCGSHIDSLKITWDECLCYFYYPNSFTPNGDIHNEVFKPVYDCRLEEYDMRIFNRWGELIFESRNPDNGWTGQYKNKPAEQGVYIVQVNYAALSGTKKIYKSITDKLALVK